jgi:acyl carrier protein
MPSVEVHRTGEMPAIPRYVGMTDEIRQIINDHGRLPIDIATIAPDADLYQAGMSSHASVNVMLALEDHFDIEFPDRMLTRDVFESIASIEAAVGELRSSAVPS